MTKVDLCHHLHDPYSKGANIKLSSKEKFYSSLGLLLLPFFVLPGLAAFYGISYALKDRSIKQNKNNFSKTVGKVQAATEKN